MSDLSFEGDVASARAFIIDAQHASVPQVQRRLRVGPNRAAQILLALEDQGVVGPTTTRGSRPVLVRDGVE